MPFIGLHWIWAVVLLVIVLILFGVGRLPSIGGALGRSIAELKRSIRNEPASPPSDSTKD